MAENNRSGAFARRVVAGLALLALGATGCSGEADAAGRKPPGTVPHRAVERDGSLKPAGKTVLGKKGRTYNGGPINLDETALLACAKAQIALVELKEGSPTIAAEQLDLAAARANESSVKAIASQADALAKAAGSPAADATTTVDSFVKLCASKGFEA